VILNISCFNRQFVIEYVFLFKLVCSPENQRQGVTQYVLAGRSFKSKVMQHQTMQTLIMCGAAAVAAIRKLALHG
jgi:hypothetical protein